MRTRFLIPKRDRLASTSICTSLISLPKDLNPSLFTKSENPSGQGEHQEIPQVIVHPNRARLSPNRLGNQSGQVIVEYILLLLIAVAAATLLTKRLVGRDPENAGAITTAWGRMNDAVGSDIID